MDTLYSLITKVMDRWLVTRELQPTYLAGTQEEHYYLPIREEHFPRTRPNLQARNRATEGATVGGREAVIGVFAAELSACKPRMQEMVSRPSKFRS